MSNELTVTFGDRVRSLQAATGWSWQQTHTVLTEIGEESFNSPSLGGSVFERDVALASARFSTCQCGRLVRIVAGSHAGGGKCRICTKKGSSDSVPEAGLDDHFVAPPVFNQADGDESDCLWNLDRTCAFLGVSDTWLYRKCARGELPHRKVGRFLRFLPEEIREWVNRNPGTPLG